MRHSGEYRITEDADGTTRVEVDTLEYEGHSLKRQSVTIAFCPDRRSAEHLISALTGEEHMNRNVTAQGGSITERRELIRKWRVERMTVAEIARRLRLSPDRVKQIIRQIREQP